MSLDSTAAQEVPTIDGACPVTLHDALAEGGGGGLVQPAPCLLHQNLTRSLITKKTSKSKIEK